jgi:hypothetical protein
MSMKLWTPKETIYQTLNFSLSDDSPLKNEVLGYQLQAQSFIEEATRRNFDGEIARTDYKAGNGQETLVLSSYPIRAITSIRVDADRTWDANDELDATDYFYIADKGLVVASDGAKFTGGERAIRVQYTGGYISEKEVIPSTAAADDIAATDNLSSYGQTFSAYVFTTGTGAAGTVTITGTDESDAAQTEVLTPNATDIAAGRPTVNYSLKRWNSITELDAAGVTGATVRLTASSFPDDLQLATRLMTTYYTNLDENFSLNESARSNIGRSVSFDDNDIPAVVQRIIGKYRMAIPAV